MKLISQLELSELLSTDRETVRKKVSHLVAVPGPRNAKLYESDRVLQFRQETCAPGEGEFINYAEAQRRLTVKRGEQIDLEMEVTRKERIPLDVIEEVNDRAFSNVAGMIKAHEGKVLTPESIADMLTELRSVNDILRSHHG